MILDLTTNAPAGVVHACETQVRDLQAHLMEYCQREIERLLGGAQHDASLLINTSGAVDIPALVQQAGMQTIKEKETQ